MKLSLSSVMTWTSVPTQGREKASRDAYVAKVIDLDEDDAPTIVVPPPWSPRRRMTRAADARLR